MHILFYSTGNGDKTVTAHLSSGKRKYPETVKDVHDIAAAFPRGRTFRHQEEPVCGTGDGNAGRCRLNARFHRPAFRTLSPALPRKKKTVDAGRRIPTRVPRSARKLPWKNTSSVSSACLLEAAFSRKDAIRNIRQFTHLPAFRLPPKVCRHANHPLCSRPALIFRPHSLLALWKTSPYASRSRNVLYHLSYEKEY